MVSTHTQIVTNGKRLEEIEVSVVLGSDRNIKITKPGDMELARLFAKDEPAVE